MAGGKQSNAHQELSPSKIRPLSHQEYKKAAALKKPSDSVHQKLDKCLAWLEKGDKKLSKLTASKLPDLKESAFFSFSSAASLKQTVASHQSKQA